MKCKVTASHLHLEKYENGNVVMNGYKPVSEIYKKGDIIDIPPTVADRLKLSVMPLEVPGREVRAGALSPDTIVKVVKPTAKTPPVDDPPKDDDPDKDPAGDKPPGKNGGKPGAK